jgi:hypothetical protein
MNFHKTLLKIKKPRKRSIQSVTAFSHLSYYIFFIQMTQGHKHSQTDVIGVGDVEVHNLLHSHECRIPFSVQGIDSTSSTVLDIFDEFSWAKPEFVRKAAECCWKRQSMFLQCREALQVHPLFKLLPTLKATIDLGDSALLTELTEHERGIVEVIMEDDYRPFYLMEDEITFLEIIERCEKFHSKDLENVSQRTTNVESRPKSEE